MHRRIDFLRRGAITVGLLGVFALAGCAPESIGKNSPPIAELPADQLHGHLTVWSWNIAAKSLQSLTPAFEKQNPSVPVTVEMNGTRLQARLMLSLAAGVGAPDIAQLQNTDAPHYIATERLTDLTPVAAQYASKFPPAIWNPCLLNGHVYAIPWDIGPCAIYYKRSVFAQYGIDPAKIDTWDDYIQAGKQIVAKSHGRTKMLPLGSNDLQTMFEMLLQQTGGQLFDTQGRVVIDSPQSRQALEIIRTMRQAGICADVPAYSQEWMAGFSGDTVATYPGAAWLGGIIEDTVGDHPGKSSDWGVFRLPAVEHGGLHVSNLGGSVLVIPQECTNKAAAWAFIKYALCTSEGQLKQYHTSDIFPGYLPALASPQMDAPAPFFGGQHVSRLFATDVAKIPPLNRTASWAEGDGYLGQDLSHWAATGMAVQDPFTALAQKMHKRLDIPIAAANQAPIQEARR